MTYLPDKILVDKEAQNYPITRRILEQLKGIEVIVLNDESDLRDLVKETTSLFKGKRYLYLKYYKGTAFKLCPGFSEDVLCCNYYVLDLVENCPLECSYCILQAFLNKPIITFHVNVEEILQQMLVEIKNRPDQPLRIGTGEHSDSLALDHLYQINPTLIEAFAGLENATLELKTKTADVESLLGLEHNGKTVISWSLNPIQIIRENEFKTASLEERLSAAKQVVADGYKVGFHFDPIIYYPDWQQGYLETIRLMFEAVAPENVAWISLGTLRYIPELKQIAEERFPKISIFSNEFIAAEDGKRRYIKPIRKELLEKISYWIKQKAPSVPLYLCMEKLQLWNQTSCCKLKTPQELEKYLNQNV